MPKLKTKRGARKRLQVKKSGQVKHARAFGKHLFTHAKGPQQKRRNRGTALLAPQDAKRVVREMFPYG